SRNPFDWMEMLRRTPHGASSVTFWSSMRGNIAIQTLATILGAHVRVGNEDNIWDMNRKRWESVRQVEWAVKTAEQFGRKVATAGEARPDHQARRVVRHGGRHALQPRAATEPRQRPEGIPRVRHGRAAAQGRGGVLEPDEHPVRGAGTLGGA